MSDLTLEELFTRFQKRGDLSDMAEVFDRTAPDLNRLARRLVRGGGAEDLVQETFLTALENPGSFSPDRALQPWLVGILVNRAREQRRREGRFLEPDRLEREPVPTPDLELSKSEHRALLETALERLPSSLAPVVRAKLEGLGHAELAEQLGLAPGTLRVRLHRGLQALRSILPPGLATAFALVFLHSSALGRVRSRTLRAARAGTAAAGAGGGFFGLWMTKELVLGASLAVLSSVLALPWLLEDPVAVGPGKHTVAAAPVAVEPAPARAAAPRREAAGPVETAPSPPPAAEPAPLPSAPVDPVRLAGRVLDEDDAPVPGAEVLAWNGTKNDGPPDRTLTADSQGAFRFDDLGPEFVLTARTDRMACTRGLRGNVEPGSTGDGLEILVAAASSLRGTVHAPDGIPVAGAEVTLWNGLNTSSNEQRTHVVGVETFRAGRGRTVTGADGSFRLDHQPPGNLGVRVKSTPYLVYREYHRAEESPVAITLDPGLELHGFVVDHEGRPAEGARVRWLPYWGNVHTVPSEVTVDERGEFTLPSLLGDEKNEVMILHEGHAIHVAHSVSPGPGGEPLRVQLVPEERIEGEVVDLEGRPVSGLQVYIEGERILTAGASYARPRTYESAFEKQYARTDVAGRFSFGHLHGGDYLLQVTPVGESQLLAETRAPGGATDLRLVLDPALTRKVAFVGTVQDGLTGEPLEAFTLVPWVEGSGRSRRFEDAGGRFEITGLPEGRLRLTGKAAGYAEASLAERNYSFGDHPVELRLFPSRTLDLRFVDGEGTPVPRGRVSVVGPEDVPLMLSSGRSMSSSSLNWREGRLVLGDLPGGPLTLRASVPGAVMCEIPIDLTYPHEGPFEVVLDGSRTVQLRYLVIDGAESWVGFLEAFGRGQPPDRDEYRERLERDGPPLRGRYSFQLISPEGTDLGTRHLGPRDDDPSGVAVTPWITLQAPARRCRLIVDRDGEILIDREVSLAGKGGQTLQETLQLPLPVTPPR